MMLGMSARATIVLRVRYPLIVGDELNSDLASTNCLHDRAPLAFAARITLTGDICFIRKA